MNRKRFILYYFQSLYGIRAILGSDLIFILSAAGDPPSTSFVSSEFFFVIRKPDCLLQHDN